MSHSNQLESHSGQTASALPSWFLVAGSAAALAGSICSEMVTNANKERFFTPTGLPPFPPELLRKVLWNNIYNHSICFGFLGSVLCGVLILVAVGTKSPAKGIVGLLLGGVAGLILGAAVGILGYFITETVQQMNIDNILKAIVIYLPVWLVLSLVTTWISASLVKLPNGFRRAFQASLITTLCTVVIYPLLVTAIFPSDWPGRIIPEFARTRLTSYIIGSLGIVVALWFTFIPSKKQTSEAQASSGT